MAITSQFATSDVLVRTALPNMSHRPSLPSLTGIRFIAALVVVLFHINITLQTIDPHRDRSTQILTHGYIGVSLFFVLSGFILAYTYIQNDDTLRGNRFAFWRARFARVYPVYLFALFVSAPLFARRLMIASDSTIDLQAALGGLFAPLLLQSWWPPSACQWNCVGWSLSVEAFFYAVFPILGIWLARRTLKMTLVTSAAIWVASLMLPLFYLYMTKGVTHADDSMFWIRALKYNPVAHLGEFVVGVACGISFVRQRAIGMIRPFPSWLVAATVLVIGLLVVGDRVPYVLLHNGIVAPLFALLIYALASRDIAGSVTMAKSRLMVRFGEGSYALYLLHSPIIEYIAIATRRLSVGTVALYTILAASVLISVALSLLVFDRIEEPARLWLRTKEAATRSLSRSVSSATLL